MFGLILLNVVTIEAKVHNPRTKQKRVQ